MKKTLFILFLLIGSELFGQILDTNTIWSEANYKLYSIKNDTTTINNKVYHYIHKYKNDSSFHYTGSEIAYLLRENSGKIYWRDTFHHKDKLLYDFNLSQGDSIYVNPISIFPVDSVLLICQNADSVMIMGTKRKRLTMQTVHPSGYYNTAIEYWLSGIGSTLGFFNPGHLNFAYVDQNDPLLLCCHEGLTFNQIYQNDSINKCYLNSFAGLHENKNKLIQIFPNPTYSKITIISNEPIQNIKLFAINGMLIKEVNSINLLQISLVNLEKGIYLIKVYFNADKKQGVITKKIIKL